MKAEMQFTEQFEVVVVGGGPAGVEVVSVMVGSVGSITE